MRFVEFLTLDTDRIHVGERLRPVDEDHVEVIAGMINEVGLQHPIEVWLPDGELKYHLIAGGHRLAAVKLLDLGSIDVKVLEPDTDEPTLEAQYREAIENLGRHDLNALDRAATLVRFKTLYEGLHPEAKRGQFGGRGGKKNETAILAVSKIAAENTGISERTFRRAVNFYYGIEAGVRARLAGAWIAKEQTQLVALSKLNHERQAQVADILLDDTNEVTRVNEANGLIDDPKPAKVDATDKMFRRLLSLYESAPKKVQTRFQKYLASQEPKPAKRTNGTSEQTDIEDAISAQGGSA